MLWPHRTLIFPQGCSLKLWELLKTHLLSYGKNSSDKTFIKYSLRQWSLQSRPTTHLSASSPPDHPVKSNCASKYSSHTTQQNTTKWTHHQKTTTVLHYRLTQLRLCIRQWNITKQSYQRTQQIVTHCIANYHHTVHCNTHCIANYHTVHCNTHCIANYRHTVHCSRHCIANYHHTVLCDRHCIANNHHTVHCNRHCIANYYHTVLCDRHCIANNHHTVHCNRHCIILMCIIPVVFLIIERSYV